MIYAVQFEDDETFAAMREKYMPRHLEFLERNAKTIKSAGPLLDSESGKPAGGLWLVSADNSEAVHTLVSEDPFWPTGLRKSVKVLHWNQVYADGKRLR